MSCSVFVESREDCFGLPATFTEVFLHQHTTLCVSMVTEHGLYGSYAIWGRHKTR